ncbi:MAG: hypothetical protein CHACPFDD_01011 [Phycisphaerae bacterium]|nr:hypothetical protein [Phycisphaerae bacterium]
MSERPADTGHTYDDIRGLIRDARRDGGHVLIRGGGVLAEPDRATHCCDMRAKSALLAHAIDDLTVTVQAGMTVASLQTLLAGHAQSLPLDAPRPQHSTIGGVIASGLSGPRRSSAGAMRDLLLGLTFVNADGELIRAGGRVVKNVAGYDLCKLFCGSWGWLGVIVEATLRLHAAPQHSAALRIGVRDASDAERVARCVLEGPFLPASMDLLLPAGASPEAPASVLLGFEGRRETVETQITACREQLAGEYLPGDDALRQRQAISDLLVDGDATIRFSAARADAAELAFQLARQCPAARVAASLASGAINAAVRVTDARPVRELTLRWAQSGVSWLLPTSRSVRIIDLPMFGPPRSDWPLMRRVKQALDPHGIFARATPFDDSLSHAWRADAL